MAERRRVAETIQAIRPASTTAPSSIHSQSRLVPDEAVGVAVTLEGAADGDAVTVTGVAGADVVTVTVVAGAVVVTVTVGLAGAVVGVASAVVGLASAVVGLAGTVAVAVRLWIALEMLETVLEHPAAKHTASRMATARKRLFVERRMLLPSADR